MSEQIYTRRIVSREWIVGIILISIILGIVSIVSLPPASPNQATLHRLCDAGRRGSETKRTFRCSTLGGKRRNTSSQWILDSFSHGVLVVICALWSRSWGCVGAVTRECEHESHTGSRPQGTDNLYDPITRLNSKSSYLRILLSPPCRLIICILRHDWMPRMWADKRQQSPKKVLCEIESYVEPSDGPVHLEK